MISDEFGANSLFVLEESFKQLSLVALYYTSNSSQIAFYINCLKLTLISLPTPTSQLGLLKLLLILWELVHSQLSPSE